MFAVVWDTIQNDAEIPKPGLACRVRLNAALPTVGSPPGLGRTAQWYALMPGLVGPEVSGAWLMSMPAINPQPAGGPFDSLLGGGVDGIHETPTRGGVPATLWMNT